MLIIGTVKGVSTFFHVTCYYNFRQLSTSITVNLNPLKARYLIWQVKLIYEIAFL